MTNITYKPVHGNNLIYTTTENHRNNIITQLFSPRWVNFFLNLADLTATQSKDPSTKCGAVLVNDNKQVIGLGFNGFPSRIRDTKEWLEDRETKYSLITHAEVNCILNATQSARNTHLFITGPSCPECTKFIIAAGVVTVHWRDSNQPEFLERWKDKLEVSNEIFKKAYIIPNVYDKEGYKI